MENFFATNLKFIREKQGLSKSQLAKKINVNQSTITRWENGEMGITVDKAYELSKVLDTPLPQLVGSDLRTLKNAPQKEFTDAEKKEALKQVLIEKGFLNENEEMTSEDFNKLIEFAKANKPFIMKDKK